ncbi:TetR/AcrR family transcriptional regulator [Pseudomonas sp. F3-2]|uniref:TetR/AcrR family transcriptional regulator n=1 Tax=Pseudomonas sp. F3-2 TaxID=3141539 RepID=UPI00315C5224
MKVTKEQRLLNKEKILTAASRLYREHGIDGIGIGELSKSVGLTHGGFYRQFPDGKEQLVAEAIRRTFDEYFVQWEASTRVFEIVQSYVTAEHRDSKLDCCPIPTLAADVSRMGGVVSQTYTQGIERLLHMLMEKKGDLPDGTSRERAMQILASISGAMMLARACNDTTLTDEIMAAVISQWRGLEDPAGQSA